MTTTVPQVSQPLLRPRSAESYYSRRDDGDNLNPFGLSEEPPPVPRANGRGHRAPRGPRPSFFRLGAVGVECGDHFFLKCFFLRGEKFWSFNM